MTNKNEWYDCKTNLSVILELANKMHKYQVLHNDLPCLLFIFFNLYIDFGELWKQASPDPGSIRKDHVLWYTLANSHDWWGRKSKHLNKWGKPEALNKRRIIEDRQSFCTCKPMVIMWSFKILPSMIIKLHGEERGWDPQEDLLSLSILFGAVIPDSRDQVAAAGKFLFTKSVWSSLLYCNYDPGLEVAAAGEEAR